MAAPRFPILRRRLLAAATIVSLILCLATVGLWVRAQFTSDSIYISYERFGFVFASWRSQWGLDLRWRRRPVMPSDQIPLFEYDRSEASPSRSAYWYLPRLWHRDVSQTDPSNTFERDIWNLRVPYWFTVASTALPIMYFRKRVRLVRRLELGLCPTCGYDLRATPERCPECGAKSGLVMRNSGRGS